MIMYFIWNSKNDQLQQYIKYIHNIDNPLLQEIEENLELPDV